MKFKSLPRICQPCTACCDGWLQIQVDGKSIFPGSPCHHSTGKGCNNYVNRPHDPCILFYCGWRAKDSLLPDWMKPSNAKVIVLFEQGIWRNFSIDLAIPVGRKIPQRALNWLTQNAESNTRLLIYSEQIVENGKFTGRQKVHAFGPADFQEEIAFKAQNNIPFL